MKTCASCKTDKPRTGFYRCKLTQDGLYNICKSCSVAENKRRRAANREQYNTYSREYQRRWRKKHPGRAKKLKKAWISKNRERHLASRSRAYLRRIHGLTLEQYELAVKAQNGKCLICNLPPSGTTKAMKKLHVDHCHKTGRIRGLLCNGCNRAIGYLGDEPERARRLAQYLEEN